MKIVVQKFGGTSIRNVDGFKKSLVHLKKELKLNHKVVAVVSAMGRLGEPYATDTLKNLIKNNVSKKEQDRLLSLGEIISSVVFTDFLIENGIKAVSLSTKEIGILTNNNFTNADIIKISELDILNKLSSFDVIVVPGFQGLTIDNDITTLGRGGSDTTAIALGIALKAMYVEIISDVEGVFTADPRIVKTAIKIPKLNYDALLEMTANGSKVLHYKGALMAKESKIKLRFSSIEDYNLYTEVEDENVIMTNISYKNDFIKYKINKPITLFEYVYVFEDDYYVSIDDSKAWEDYLNENEIPFKKMDNYTKITVIKYDIGKSVSYEFVETPNAYAKINEVHDKMIKTG